MTDADMHELLKISNLIEHFQEHFEGEPDSTVLELLEMHYSSDSKTADHHGKDHDKHTGNVPFQSHTCCHSVTVYVVEFYNDIDFKFFPSDIPVISFYSKEAPPILARTIWQPPKLHV